MMWDDDSDLPLPEDLDDANDAPAMMECPSCGAPVIEDAEKCPACGDWITPIEPSGAFSKKWWIAVAVLIMLYAMFRFVM